MEQGIKGRLARGVIWLGATRILISLIGMVSTIVLARLLTPVDFGLVAISTTTLAILTSLTEMSLASALVQRDTVEDEDIDAVWSLGIMRAVLVAVVLASLSQWLANVYEDQRLVAVLIVTGLTGGLSGIINPKVTLLTRDLRFKQQFVIQGLQKFATFAVSVTVALIYHSYWALVLGALAAAASTAIVSYIIVPYRPHFRVKNARSLFSFSIWLSLSQLMIMLNWRFEQVLIGYFLGKRELGIYVVADGLASIPTREAVQPLSQTLFPGFAKVKNDPERLRKAYLLAQATIVSVALPAGFGFAVLARPLVLLAMGEKWETTIPMIQIFSAMFALQTMSGAVQGLGMATDHTRNLFQRDARSFLFRIPLVGFGLWFGGVFGLIVGRFIATMINTSLDMGLATKLIGVSVFRQVRHHWRSFIAVAVMVAASTGAMALVPDPRMLVAQIAAGGVAGGAAYLLTLAALWNAAGRPSGPEQEAARILNGLWGRMMSRKELSTR